MGVGAVLVLCTLMSVVSSVYGISDPTEVNALSTMFVNFNQNPSLTGWTQNNGDPCGAAWRGIVCSPSNFITSIKLPGLGLNGTMQGWVLQNLKYLQALDVSNNNISGEMPQQFPANITQLYMNNNQFTGGLPQLDQSPSLLIIDLSNNILTGNINPQIFTTLVALTSLDFSYNQLQGPLPDTVNSMVALQTMNLQNNQLSGQLPTSLSQLTNLQTFNIENNQFTGNLPAGFKPQTYLYSGNPGLNGVPGSSPPSTPANPSPQTPTTQSGGGGSWFNTTTHVIAVAAAGAALVLVIFAILLFLCIRRKAPKTTRDDQESNPNNSKTWFIPEKGEQVVKQRAFEPAVPEKGIMEVPEETVTVASSQVKTLKAPPSFKNVSVGQAGAATKSSSSKVNRSNISLTPFSVADLQAATDSFSQGNLIGEGSMGRVYRAEFANGQVLAVKKIDTSNASMVENEDDFLSVVQGLARLQHTNTAELVGYCVEHDQRLLVYEYISRGTLDELLHYSGENTKGLSWNVRIKIALGSARALEYLHEVCAPPVVHRNFKSANILLDDELNPHVSDCGLAALAPSGSEREVSAQMLGSFGYSAPEYAMSGTYTVKSDVYSFGVVMLELLTGRKPLDSTRPRSEQSLVRWATPQLHDIDALARMVDPALKGKYPAKSLSRLADIVALCVQPEPEFRPPMSEVVQSLVRLMQRASLSKRRSDSEAGLDYIEPSENSI